MAPRTPSFTQWHRLFGLVLEDVFYDSPWLVELEKDLARRAQLLDVVLLRRRAGSFAGTLPDGLDPLRDHNLLSYKSLREPLDAWALDELTGHYVNYRKQLTERDEPLTPEAHFQRFAVSTRHPQKLFHALDREWITPGAHPGVYDIQWGAGSIRLIVTSEVRAVPENAPWQLFSARAEAVAYGAAHFQPHRSELRPALEQLLTFYHLEGLRVSYTLQDFVREYVREHLDALPPEEVLRRYSPEEVIGHYSPEEVLGHYSPEEIERYLQKLRKQ